MDDSTLFSKDFHSGLGRDFSLRGARLAVAEGTVGEWLQGYLRADAPWTNLGLADGLLLVPRRYDLFEASVDLLDRKCGPEPDMEFWQDRESFERSVSAIAESLERVEDMPPLVVEAVGDRLSVCDGTHRLEAVRRRGWKTCWVIRFSEA